MSPLVHHQTIITTTILLLHVAFDQIKS